MCSPSIVHNVHFEMFLRGCRYNSLCLNVLHKKQEVVAMMILSSYDDIIFQERRWHNGTATPADGKILSFLLVSVTARGVHGRVPIIGRACRACGAGELESWESPFWNKKISQI